MLVAVWWLEGGGPTLQGLVALVALPKVSSGTERGMLPCQALLSAWGIASTAMFSPEDRMLPFYFFLFSVSLLYALQVVILIIEIFLE